MASTYNGNPASVSNYATTPIDITVPSDGDGETAASVNAPIEEIADYMAYTQANAALVGTAVAFTSVHPTLAKKGTTLPTPAASAYFAYKESQIAAFGYFKANGTLVAGFGLQSISVPGTGTYEISGQNGWGLSDGGSPAKFAFAATAVVCYSSGDTATYGVCTCVQLTASSVRVYITNLAGTLIDAPFSLHVFGT